MEIGEQLVIKDEEHLNFLFICYEFIHMKIGIMHTHVPQ